jgi:hypothetical protein
MDATRFDDLARSLATAATRRRVVTTGAKLAYTVPIVAATSHLMASSASACTEAEKVCPPGSTPRDGGCASCPAGYTLRSDNTCKYPGEPPIAAHIQPKRCPGGPDASLSL